MIRGLARGIRLRPSWLGDDRLHKSHRSKLLGKDPEYYGKYFRDVPPDLDYFWPEPDEVRPVDTTPIGQALWVVQPPSPQALGRFLEEAMIGLGAGSGIEVDATGQDLEGLRRLPGGTPRRVNRPMAALARLLTEVHVGDEVAVPIQGGRVLMVGEIVSDYQFVPGSNESVIHRRRVRWDRFLPRSAVQPVFALQDVRPLFRVNTAIDHSTMLFR